MDICNAEAELVHIQHKTQQPTVVKELVSTLDTTAPSALYLANHVFNSALVTISPACCCM